MKNKLGFTFVEIIIAMAIFAILIVGVFPAFLIGVKLNTTSRISVELSTQAQGVVEEIYGYSGLTTHDQTVTTLTGTYGAPVPFGTSSNRFTKVTTEYRIVIELTKNWQPVGLPSITGMSHLKVIVSKLSNPYNVPPAQAETTLLFK